MDSVLSVVSGNLGVLNFYVHISSPIKTVALKSGWVLIVKSYSESIVFTFLGQVLGNNNKIGNRNIGDK